MSTAAQITANRANSQFSSGPKTDVGKTKVSLNAVKSALTGQTILLPTDDVAAYEQLSQSMIEFHRPATYMEEILVQSLIDTEWRLRRIPTLESAIYSLGYRECCRPLPSRTKSTYKYSSNTSASLKTSAFRNARLRRMHDKDLASLRELQAERKEKEEAEKKSASNREDNSRLRCRPVQRSQSRRGRQSQHRHLRNWL